MSGDVYAREEGPRDSSKIVFDGQEYSYKWTSDNLHEFTPGEQSVTGQWKDMVTVNYYPVVATENDLALVTKAVLSNYEDAGGIVLGVETLPGSQSKPVEYVIAVVFGASELAEFALVKFLMHDGIGASVAYAHREYGTDMGTSINDWMDANGARLKEEITNFTDLPPHSDFQIEETIERLSRLGMAV